MRAIKTVLFALAATFFAVVKSADLNTVSFYETMSEGDSVILAEHGPFTFACSCDSSATTLDVFIEASEEDYIFSSEDHPINMAVGDTASYPGVFSVTSYGNDDGEGGFVSASGYYVGWNGESVIALHTTDGSVQPLFGDDVQCVISGVVNLIENI